MIYVLESTSDDWINLKRVYENKQLDQNIVWTFVYANFTNFKHEPNIIEKGFVYYSIFPYFINPTDNWALFQDEMLIQRIRIIELCKKYKCDINNFNAWQKLGYSVTNRANDGGLGPIDFKSRHQNIKWNPSRFYTPNTFNVPLTYRNALELRNPVWVDTYFDNNGKIFLTGDTV